MDIKTYLETLNENDYIKLFPVKGGDCILKGYVTEILSDEYNLSIIIDLTFDKEYKQKDYKIIMFSE